MQSGCIPVGMGLVDQELRIFRCSRDIACNLRDDGICHPVVVAIILYNDCRRVPALGFTELKSTITTLPRATVICNPPHLADSRRRPMLQGRRDISPLVRSRRRLTRTLFEIHRVLRARSQRRPRAHLPAPPAESPIPAILKLSSRFVPCQRRKKSHAPDSQECDYFNCSTASGRRTDDFISRATSMKPSCILGLSGRCLRPRCPPGRRLRIRTCSCTRRSLLRPSSPPC